MENPKVLLTPSSLIEEYYPGIEEALSKQINNNNDTIDILLLGASVLHPIWGTIEEELQKKLTSTYTCKVNVTNLSKHSHTSLDSKIKYDLLQSQQYDVILLYHGINEVRFNNCPKSIFDNNYLHVEFYNQINAVTNKIGQYSILPYTITSIIIGLREKFGNQLMSVFKPKEEWLKYGSEIKTADVFYENYKSIVELARDNNTSVIMPTFAYHIPKYSDSSIIKKGNTDSEKLKVPIEIWGQKENVIKGIDAHNNMIKNYVSAHKHLKNVYSVDMNDLISKKRENFNDICHLTKNGSIEYVSIVFPILQSIIAKHKLCLPIDNTYL